MVDLLFLWSRQRDTTVNFKNASSGRIYQPPRDTLAVMDIAQRRHQPRSATNGKD